MICRGLNFDCRNNNNLQKGNNVYDNYAASCGTHFLRQKLMMFDLNFPLYTDNMLLSNGIPASS